MAKEVFGNCAPFLALLFGFLAGLLMLRSARWVFVAATALLLLQVTFWTVFLTFADARGAESDWNPGLAAAFSLTLVAVVPYTAIGTVVSATAVAVTRRIGRRRAQK